MSTTRLPVTNPALTNSDGERYVLGHATTERGALRILNKRFGTRRVIQASIVRLGHSRGPRSRRVPRRAASKRSSCATVASASEARGCARLSAT